MNKKIAVVIPCFNVQNHILGVVNGLLDKIDFIITVNDMSTDNTFDILNELDKDHSNIIVINHEINQGVGGALKSGFKKCFELKPDYIIKIDGDGQMNDKYINELILKINNNDLGYSKGNRFVDRKNIKKMPFVRRLGNLGLGFLTKISSGYWNVFDPTNGFFCITLGSLRKLDFNNLSERYFFESSMLIELYYSGTPIYDVSMPAIYNDEESHLSIKKVLFSFPYLLFKALVNRIWFRYFLVDFNIGSTFLIFGLPLFLFGVIYGLSLWTVNYINNIVTPTGSIMISALSIILGFQLLLSFIHFDIENGKLQK